MLAGFSQGGAVVLHHAYKHRLPDTGRRHGAVDLCASFEDAQVNRGGATPVLCLHGEQDDVVPLALGRAAYEALVAAGVEALWHSYPMRHEVIPRRSRTSRAGCWHVSAENKGRIAGPLRFWKPVDNLQNLDAKGGLERAKRTNFEVPIRSSVGA